MPLVLMVYDWTLKAFIYFIEHSTIKYSVNQVKSLQAELNLYSTAIALFVIFVCIYVYMKHI